MENFILTIERKQTQEELMNLEPIMFKMDFDTQQECIDSVRGFKELLFRNDEVNAYLTINRHSVDGNEPCSKFEIDLETLELK